MAVPDVLLLISRVVRRETCWGSGGSRTWEPTRYLGAAVGAGGNMTWEPGRWDGIES